MLPSALLLALAGGAAHGLPSGPTPAAELSTKDFSHHEFLRIDRDFGMSQWQIALDGWLPRTRVGHLEDVRLWWVNTDKDDHRKPFSRHLRRFIEFDYERGGAGTLKVRLAGDRKEYRFSVEVDAAGVPAVFADVTLDDGAVVPRCRCASGRLLARRVLGIPVGIAALSVQCTDDADATHEGVVPFRELDGGAVYTP
jgi:hypothetical protein